MSSKETHELLPAQPTLQDASWRSLADHLPRMLLEVL
jgi:hypothetical protein